MTIPAPPEGFTEEVKAPVETAKARNLPAAPEGFTEEVDPNDQSYLAGLARSSIGQGMFLGWGDELVARIRQLAGEDYDTALSDEREKMKAFRNANPKTAIAGEIAGSFATPGLGLLGGIIKPAASLAGRMVQGAGIGSAVGATAGAGAAEQNTAQGAIQGAGLGAAVGPVAPVLAKGVGAALEKGAEVLGPTLARAGAHMRGGAPDEAAADNVMKSWMRSGGDTPQTFRDQIAAAERAGTFYGGGKSASVTESPLVIADLSPSMQKLAGSVTRASPEAATRAEAVISSRQTGVAPKSQGAQDMVTEAGIVTRNPLAPKVADAEPAGQFERIRDAMKRAFTIKDADFHGHEANAYRTEQSLMKALKTEADKLYGEARKAAQNFNVQPTIMPAVKKWADEAVSAQVTEGRLIRRALQQFTTGDGKLVTSLDGFDKGKRALDSMIEVAINKGDKNAARVLSGVKDDMVSAVDAVAKQGIGKKYADARGFFSSQMEMKEAIDLGRKAFRENSDVAAEQFASLTKGQQKLFRLGMLESFEANLGGAKSRAADLTRAFDTPRMQELLRTVIPRTTGQSGKVDLSTNISRNPERFGDFIGNEKAMVATRDRVLGNSATAGRLGDDARLTRQTVGEMFDRYRQSPSLFAVGMEAISTGLTKVFGFREDVAQTLARRLFTANPAEREAILARLEAQWGPDKIGSLAKAMDVAASAASVAIPAQGGRAIGEARK